MYDLTSKRSPKIGQMFKDPKSGFSYHYTGKQWKPISSDSFLLLNDLDFIFSSLKKDNIVDLVLAVDKFKWSDRSTKDTLLLLLNDLSKNKSKIFSMLVEEKLRLL